MHMFSLCVDEYVRRQTSNVKRQTTDTNRHKQTHTHTHTIMCVHVCAGFVIRCDDDVRVLTFFAFVSLTIYLSSHPLILHTTNTIPYNIIITLNS